LNYSSSSRYRRHGPESHREDRRQHRPTSFGSDLLQVYSTLDLNGTNLRAPIGDCQRSEAAWQRAWPPRHPLKFVPFRLTSLSARNWNSVYLAYDPGRIPRDNVRSIKLVIFEVFQVDRPGPNPRIEWTVLGAEVGELLPKDHCGAPRAGKCGRKENGGKRFHREWSVSPRNQGSGDGGAS
jgi:hypothetical protein